MNAMGKVKTQGQNYLKDYDIGTNGWSENTKRRVSQNIKLVLFHPTSRKDYKD